MDRRKRTVENTTARPAYVPREIIVRFKPGAVDAVAHAPQRTRRSGGRRIVSVSVPDQVAEPLDYLRTEVGIRSIKPLFIAAGQPQPQRRSVRSLSATHGAVVQSATDVSAEALKGFQKVELSAGADIETVIKTLNDSRAVDFAEQVPNRWPAARRVPSDPHLNRQWGLRAIRWFEKPRPDASGVHVAVLDSGIDEGHPELGPAIESYQYAPYHKRDFLGHGTHVSGTLAAVINNDLGIAGIANCRLHCWKIFTDPPAGSDEYDFDFDVYSQGLAAALDSEVKVVNLSIGGTASSKTEALVFKELADAGVIAVAAMGNEFQEGNPVEYPAAYKGVVAIGAIDEADRRADFSNTGRHISLVAPGVHILSTVPRQRAILANATEYDSWPGTSMATPHVAGCAALLYASRAKSAANAAKIIERLKSTARKLPGMRGKPFTKDYGYGLVDIGTAL